jgi:Zn-dependent protease
MNQQFGPLLYTISIWALPAIIAITFHEAAHGFAARMLGDDTAWRLGRVTFNPLKHIDPVGTILLPGLLLFLHSPFLFGYAKPVPVNFRALRNPRRDIVLVAAAGASINIVLALVAAPTPRSRAIRRTPTPFFRALRIAATFLASVSSRRRRPSWVP